MAKTTTFQLNVAGGDGGVYGVAYLWSNPSNWSNGVPVNGDTVIEPAQGLDDIANLSLAALTVSSKDLLVEGALAVGTLSLGAGASLDLDSSTILQGFPAAPSLSIGTIVGTGHSILAGGKGSLVVVNSDPGENYGAVEGGTIELGGAVANGSTLGYGGGTIALAAPGPTIAAMLQDVGTGDVLELPGTVLTAVSAEATSLSFTTDKGTYAFSNVTYLTPFTGVSSSVDPATGLLALVFDPAADSFSRSVAAGAGQYPWSNPANWSRGVPGVGDHVAMAVSGIDNLGTVALQTFELTGSATLLASGNSLQIGTLELDGIGGIDANPVSGTEEVLIGQLTSATGAGRLEADADAVIGVFGTVDPGATYVASGGGEIALNAPLAAASSLVFHGAGAFDLTNPGATTTASVLGVAPGDTLELPGSSVAGVTFGAPGLTATTSAGTFAFSNVGYAGPVRGYTVAANGRGNVLIGFTAADTFQQASAPVPGIYAWSTAANWTSGVPGAGAAVNTGVTGFDDIGNLSLASLALSAGGNVLVTTGLLQLGTLAAGAGTLLAADGTAAFVVATAVSGTGAVLGAEGSLSAFADLAATDPGETYFAQAGGTVKLAAAPAAASTLQFGGVGTFELFAPGASVAAPITGIVAGDRLELPGTISGVTLGASSLVVTTNFGTTTFSNLAFAGGVTGVTSGTDSASGLATLTFTDQAKSADFNGDGTSDQLWQAASGAIIDYTTKNGAITAAAVVGGLTSSYRFLAAGDFNGDGTADQLWQAASGAIVDYAMRNGAITGASIVGSLDSTFKFLAAADFNGDGTTDQLWQAASGAIIDYTMQNGTITAATEVGVLDSTTKFLAAADFNGDGTADQLWQAANGAVIDYAMSNGTISAANVVGGFDSTMKFLAAADFNGDGRADTLWQNTATGAIIDDTMNGASIVSSAVVGTLDSTWKFLAAGDFNGDGTADQLWQASGSGIVDFTMKNGAITSGTLVGSLDATFRLLA